jgi:hypothetical protein
MTLTGRLLCFTAAYFLASNIASGKTATVTTSGSVEPADTIEVQTTSESGTDRLLPLGADWAREKGIDLPLPFGVGAFFILMSRDIEVTDVQIQFEGRPKESINDFASFAVRNSTTVGALRLDAWILPLLNLYAMAGYTWTNSNLNARFTIDRIILPRPPVVIEIEQDSRVAGPYFGGGGTVVAGYGRWFVLADANYGRTDLDEFEGSINFWFLAARTGWSGKAGRYSWRAWAGAAYLAADRTLTAVVDTESLGEVRVEIDQRPVNPWTAQLGGGLGVGKRFEMILEAGSNFNDAILGVLSAAFRF